MTRPVIEFWYEFASTYSYLTAMRIEALAADRDVAVRWRPFLLGPIFGKLGWNTSPFNVYSAKGAYMWRDMVRLTAENGLPFKKPDPFPQNGLLAARVAHVLDPGDVPAFSRAVFTAQFGEGRQIADPDTLVAILSALGLAADRVLAQTQQDTVKTRVRDAVTAAEAAGIFGAPSFTTADGELYWGNDRLEQAIDHALRLASR